MLEIYDPLVEQVKEKLEGVPGIVGISAEVDVAIYIDIENYNYLLEINKKIPPEINGIRIIIRESDTYKSQMETSFSSVVNIFKNSGKWYTDIVISFKNKHNLLLKEAFKKALQEALKPGDFNGMIAVCINPVHPNSHPLIIKIDDVW